MVCDMMSSTGCIGEPASTGISGPNVEAIALPAALRRQKDGQLSACVVHREILGRFGSDRAWGSSVGLNRLNE